MFKAISGLSLLLINNFKNQTEPLEKPMSVEEKIEKQNKEEM